MTPPSLVDRDDAVLFVIDVQERLLPAIDDGPGVAARIARLIRFADIVGLPVILTEQQKLGDTVEVIRAELPDAVPFTKADFSCFGSDEFAAHLRDLGRGTLILTGIEAHICVAQTALEALSAYRVHVVTDAVSSRHPHDKAVALDRLRDAGCAVTTSEMLMYEVLRCAGTDEFRAVLKLVKDSP
jgi:nicotinamidase-related amidase